MRVSFSREKRMALEENFMKMGPTTLECGKIISGMAKANT